MATEQGQAVGMATKESEPNFDALDSFLVSVGATAPAEGIDLDQSTYRVADAALFDGAEAEEGGHMPFGFAASINPSDGVCQGSSSEPHRNQLPKGFVDWVTLASRLGDMTTGPLAMAPMSEDARAWLEGLGLVEYPAPSARTFKARRAAWSARGASRCQSKRARSSRLPC